MIRFRCPKCESQMEVDESFGGRSARCPTCGFGLRVPKQGQPSAPPAAAVATPRKGAATVTVDGETVEVVPPLETMVVVAMAFVATAAIVPLLIGVVLASLFQYPWTVGATLGALAGLLGLLIAVPGYHNVRRSRGRRRGRTHALICMAVGGGLFLVCLVGAIAGFAINVWMRPTCEQNLEKIYGALRVYADAHDGAFPVDLEVLVHTGGLSSPNWLTCPAYSVRIGQPTYILTPKINLKNPLFPPDLVIASDGPPYHSHADGLVRFLLLSGEVKTIEQSKWDAFHKAQVERWNGIMNQILEPEKVAAQKQAEAEAAKEKEQEKREAEAEAAKEKRPPPAAPKAPPAKGPAKEAAP